MQANGVFDLLQGQLSESMLDQLTGQIRGATKEQTAIASQGIISSLLGALSKNAASEQGASSLARALDRDHDGSVLNDFLGMAMGNNNILGGNSRTMDGAGIVGHILGGKMGGVLDMVSQMSGMKQGNSLKLLLTLAPLVMGALGKVKKTNNLDAGGLGSLLQNEITSSRAKRAEMSMIEKLLDRDGDGSTMDDLAGMGMKVLGNLLKR